MESVPIGLSRFSKSGKTVEAAYYFPKVLQGKGALHLKFKPGSAPQLSDITRGAEAVTAAELKEKGWAWKWVDNFPARKGRVPETPVRFFFVEPWTEQQWNHGRLFGVAVLSGGGSILFVEFW